MFYTKPVFILIFWVSVFLPQELSFYIGSARLEIYRVILLLVSPFIFSSLIKYRLKVAEFFLVVYVVTSMVSFLYHGEFGGLEAAVVIALEVFVTYLWGRAIVFDRGHKAIFDSVKILTLFFFILAPFAILENITGLRLFHALASQMTGIPTEVYVRWDYYRNGIARAGTVFVHPILYSIMAMSVFYVSMAYLKERGGRFKAIFGYLTAVVSSMSSVGFLMLAMQYLIFMVDKMIRKVPVLKYLFLCGAILGAIVIQIGTEQGLFRWLAINSALNKWNAYIRIIQWESAVDDVLDNPLLGIGFREWSRPFWLPTSIDTYWLYTAVTNGLVAVTFLGIFWVLALKKHLEMYSITKEPLFLAFFAAISSLVFAGFTVHFFDKTPVFVYFLLGLYMAYAYTCSARKEE